MISLKKRQSGFTIVELLIVIVVIGILAALVITTYGGIQAKARNAKRQSDLASLQTHIEAFYTQSGYYPSLADLNNSGWRAINMKSIDTGALTDPSNPASTTLVAGTGTAKSYAYNVGDSTGNPVGASCEAADTTCAKYVLTATYEGTVNGAATYTKSNLD